ncbi:hypothetical protein V3C99_009224 [Haemonchus contortus]|uniref:non-specific protein-tyrosine kinase n=1 Tax=Haemonchus contortus TaxID=6289 RepID=A0A7I4Z6I9_HAECO
MGNVANNEYTNLLLCAGGQGEKPDQNKKADMAKLVDEAAEKLIAELENENWYHGALPLEDVICLITVRGDFLLRALEAEAGRPPVPCLTVRVDNHIKDFPIHTVQQMNRPFFTIDGVNKAPTAIAIVQKHFTEKIPVGAEALLIRPIPKQAWELSKDKISMDSKLGEGAFGEVWKGTLKQFSTTVQVAIKVTKVKEENKALMQEMHKEARLMRQYKHLNIVAFYGMVIDNDRAMIVMEMVPGGGLDHYLKNNSVSCADRCSYAFDVSLGLYYLHNKRCMHRDIACRNCLIDNQRNIVKISDFGLSKQADKYKIQGFERVPVKWQAPEVVATRIYTRESDVYSYGILVWEIFNDAKQPFEEFSNKTVRRRLADPTFRPPLSPDIPHEIRIIVNACWCALPEQRPVMKDVAWILKKYIRHSIPGDAQNRSLPVPAQSDAWRRSSSKDRDRSIKSVKSKIDSRRSKMDIKKSLSLRRRKDSR